MVVIRTKKSIVLCLFLIGYFLSNGCDHSKTSKKENKELSYIAGLYHKGKLDSSIQKGKEFIKEYPENDKGYHLLSSAYLAKGNDSLAKYYANEALSHNPNNHIALISKGILLDKKGKYEEAQKYYEKALAVADPVIPQIYSNYASNRLAVGEYELAVKYGEKAVSMANKIGDKALLCLSYHKAGMTEKRDSLFSELQEKNYPHINDLKEIFNR